jgi:transcriptional regulator with XRE-family HTH domain
MLKPEPVNSEGDVGRARDEGFGRRLKEAMARRGVQAVQLATALKVAAQTVSRWRRGECPDDLRIAQLAGYLRIAEDWLRTGAGEIESRIHLEAPSSPVGARSPRRATLEAVVARLEFLHAQFESYRRLGRAPSPEVLGEWMRLTADAEDALRPRPPMNGGGPPSPPAGPRAP